jgi:dihydroorotase-like cyclic amidohydrolase
MTPLLLTNCHVIPCDGRPTSPTGAVLIEGTSIRAVDRRDALEPLLRDLGEVRTLDLGGRWLMPGLMDVHVHLALAPPGIDTVIKDGTIVRGPVARSAGGLAHVPTHQRP